MTVWNIRLGKRHLILKVKKILEKQPNFIVILDSFGNQHQLSEIDFPSFEWENIVPGSIITLTVSKSVTGWRIQPPKVEKSIKKLIYLAGKNTLGCSFVWICQSCGAEGYVEYADGDDSQRIAERILMAHAKENRPCCNQNIHIWDHRGVRQEDSERFLSSCKITL